VRLIPTQPHDRSVGIVLPNLQLAQQLDDLIEFVLETVQSLIRKADRLVCHSAPYRKMGTLALYSSVSSSRVQR
jgi:hypothetical protein